MWKVRYRGYIGGAWRILEKTVKAESEWEARMMSNIWEKLIIKIERVLTNSKCTGASD